MLTAEQLSEFHAITEACAPELLHQPLSIFDAADIPPELRENTSDCLGWTTGGMRSVAFSSVPGWRGVGTVVVIDVAAVTEAARSPESIGPCLRGVFVHELAHNLTIRPPLSMFPPDYAPTDGAQRFAQFHLAGEIAKPEPAPGSDDDHHGIKFVRAVTHVLYRALTAGFNVTCDRLFGGTRLWLAHPEFYLRALVKECADSVGKPFAEIMSTEPPSEFLHTWRGDLNYYRQSHQRKEPPCQAC
jgi:hypothetical protein